MKKTLPINHWMPILQKINEEPGIYAQDIIRRGVSDYNTLNKYVQVLETKGFINRITSEDDKRRKKNYTTEKGRIISEAISIITKELEE